MEQRKISIKNPVMFGIIMKDPEFCIGLLERIFPGRKVKDLRFVYASDEDEEQLKQMERLRRYFAQNKPESEKTIVVDIEAKSVRMDVLFEDDLAWYDIELQVENVNHPPKRSRYYHAVKAVDSLNTGQPYEKLKPGFVIFICCFDLFSMNEPVYSFQMYDANLCLPLGDEQYTMFLNSTCTENVPKELESFYCYLRTGEVAAGDIWLERMDAAVEAASLRKEVRRKVTLYDEMQMMSSLLKEAEVHLEKQKQEIAAKQLELDAKAAQLEHSQAQLEHSQAQLEHSQAQLEAMNCLNARLAELGRIDDIIKAASDEAYCSQLMSELNMK